MAQDKQNISWETIKHGLLQLQGELYPSQSISNHHSLDKLLEFHTSFYETISSEFLVQGSFKHTHFFTRALVQTGLELSTSRTESEPPVSIELTSLLH